MNSTRDQIWNDFVMRASGGAAPRAGEAPLYALWEYQSQVLNGGHHQYFFNFWDRPDSWSLAAIGAERIGLPDVARAVAQGAEIWRSKPRPQTLNVQTYMESARQGDFDEIDDAVFNLEEDFQAAFENAVLAHEDK